MRRKWRRSTRSRWADLGGVALLGAVSDRLDHLEALELGMAEIGRLGVAGPRMRGTKSIRFGPGFESGMVGPDRVRGVQRVVLELGPTQQMKFDETLYLVQMGIARKPDLLEGGLGALDDAEAVHGDVHGDGLLMF